MSTTIYSTGSTSSGFSTNQRPLSMWSVLEKDYPRETPLTTFLAKMKSQERGRYQYYWSNDAEVPYTITGLTAASSGDITNVTDYAYLRKFFILFNPRTGEAMQLIGSNPSSTTIDGTLGVTRGIMGTAASILPTDVLLILPAEYEEGSESSETLTAVNTEDYNYMSILQHAIKTTKSAAAEDTYFGETKRQESQRKLLREWKIKCEMKYWFGERRNTATAGGLYTRGFGGVYDFLNTGTNRFEVDGVLTEQMFRSHLRDVWTAHPGDVNVAFFGSPDVIGVVEDWAADKIRTSVNADKYGYNIKSYRGVFDIDLVPVPLFAATDTTNEMGFLLDMSQFKACHLRGRAPVMEKGVQIPVADYYLDIIRGELGLYRFNEKRHSMLTGIAA